MNVLSRGTLLRTRLVGKNVLWAVGGAAMATVIAVKAQQATDTLTKADCELTTAAQNAVNNRLTVIGRTQPDPAKYFTVGGVQSCIGAVSNIDLSKLIPDPMGILTSIAQQLVNAGIRAACTAARQSLSDTLGKYNTAAGMLNGSGTAITGYISTEVGQKVGVGLTNYGTTYSAPPGVPTQINPLDGVTAAVNQSTGGAAATFNAPAAATATSSEQPGAAAAQPTPSVTDAVKNGLSNLSNLGSSIFGGN